MIQDENSNNDISFESISPNNSVSLLGTRSFADFLGDQLSDVQHITQKYQKTSSDSVAESHQITRAFETLKKIETSKSEQNFEFSLKLLEVCEMLTNEAIVAYIKSDTAKKLKDVVCLALQQVSQLTTKQLAGLFAISFMIRGQCWISSVQMMSKLGESDRSQVLVNFKDFAINQNYSETIVNWIISNWKVIAEQQLYLIEHLVLFDQKNEKLILDLSLGVTFDDTLRYFTFAKVFVHLPAGNLVLDAIEQLGHNQHKMPYDCLIKLADYLMKDTNKAVIEAKNTELMKTPLLDWVTLLEKAASTVNLSDKSSIQEAINDFVETYGAQEQQFTHSLFGPNSFLSTVLYELTSMPNNKQSALAQYCIGTIKKHQKQLWCVPSGQGKSRIIALCALIGLKTGLFQNVSLIFNNQYLMDRDKKVFQQLWHVTEYKDKVQYYVGLSFIPKNNSLILVDESDKLMFEEPKLFQNFIDAKFCICFTATPNNCDERGLESRVIQALSFVQRQYLTEQSMVQIDQKLRFDEINQSQTVDQKAQYIQSLLNKGSVLVYANQDLYSKLIQLKTETIFVVNEDMQFETLGQLDEPPYKLLISVNQFGMRGIDYRSKTNCMYLVIAKQFTCEREALQGVERVGRFGDPCYKIKFCDCEQLVNQEAKQDYTAKLLAFISNTLSKTNFTQAQASNAASTKAPMNKRMTQMIKGQTHLNFGPK